MLDKLFPQPVTNEYQGQAVAKWVFALVTILTIARSLAHILLPDGGAQSIATIPLDEFTANGAATAVHLFALWGLSNCVGHSRSLALPVVGYLFIFVEYTVRLLLTFAKPLETHGTAPGAIGNYLIIPLALSHAGPGAHAPPQPAGPVLSHRSLALPVVDPTDVSVHLRRIHGAPAVNVCQTAGNTRDGAGRNW
jgi:hypothetical protein